MTAPRQIVCCIAGALLLGACSSATQTPRQLVVQPNYQINHATNETADAYYQLARYHQGQGNLDVALAGYTYAIARDPEHVEARIAAAAIHAQQGRLEQARAMMLAVVADHPNAAQAHNNLGYIDYLRGDHASAVREIGRALALEPGNARARNNLALAETALAHAAPGAPAAAPLTASASAPSAPALAAVAAPAPVATVPTAPRMELVQVIPNVYELKMAAPQAALPTVAPAAGAPAAATVTARVEVSNGAGTPGLARRVGALLGKQGVAVARLTNQRPFGQQTTQILYRPAHAAQAETLRQMIDGPVQMTASAQLSGGTDVRVVLGRDMQQALAQREAAPGAAGVAMR